MRAKVQQKYKTKGLNMSDNISKLTLSDLSGAFKANKMKISEGLKHLRAFAEKHELTDSETLEAFRKAKKVFE
jgi:hypothetical protein